MTTPGSDPRTDHDDVVREPPPATHAPPVSAPDGGSVPPAGDRPAPTAPEIAPARSRIGGAWVTAIVTTVILLLLLIFILENGQSAEISFLGQHGHLPQGVALLLAAVAGALLVAIPGSARIVQLRLRQHRQRRALVRRS